jgi:predicted O-methyltransferase YrrM
MRQSAITLESETTPAERRAVIATLSSAALSGPHLEIGTAAGGTLKELMRIYPDDARPRFVVVDPFTYYADQRGIVERNLRESGLDPASVDFRQGYSWPLLVPALAARERFSFIFIDGNHGAEHVMQDLAWTRLLEPGGLVALHDHNDKFPGVVWATGRFLRKHPNYEKIAHADSLVILRKNAASPVPEVPEFDLRLARWMVAPLRWRRSLRKRTANRNRGS